LSVGDGGQQHRGEYGPNNKRTHGTSIQTRQDEQQSTFLHVNSGQRRPQRAQSARIENPKIKQGRQTDDEPAESGIRTVWRAGHEWNAIP
jgi:hypothetical protein